METLKFKTTIKCSGCGANVTPFLNKTAGQDNWSVDTQNPDKILTVSKQDNITPAEIVKAVQEAGYKIESLN